MQYSLVDRWLGHLSQELCRHLGALWAVVVTGREGGQGYHCPAWPGTARVRSSLGAQGPHGDCDWSLDHT